jgi:serine/threonine-protein kinase
MQGEVARDAWVGLAPGDVVADAYRVTRVISETGTGVVVEAVHEADSRRVAIKAMRPSSEPDATARFLFEAKAVAQIKSTHVARVLDVATLAGGAPFVVMEYLEGHDLGALVKGAGVLPIGDAIDYVLQACEALAEAHSAGIVHQDLKPSNIFLTMTPEGTTLVKLLDFGISHQGGAEGELRSTSKRVIVGSPIYMAPEQARSLRKSDLRADIWSLGIILHEILTGQMPFAGATPAEVSASVAADAPIPCRSQRPDVPAAVEAVILRCLEKAPEDRFANVGELAAALVAFGPDEAPLSMRRIVSTLERANKVTAAPPAMDLVAQVSMPAMRPLLMPRVPDSGVQPRVLASAPPSVPPAPPSAPKAPPEPVVADEEPAAPEDEIPDAVAGQVSLEGLDGPEAAPDPIIIAPESLDALPSDGESSTSALAEMIASELGPESFRLAAVMAEAPILMPPVTAEVASFAPPAPSVAPPPVAPPAAPPRSMRGVAIAAVVVAALAIGVVVVRGGAGGAAPAAHDAPKVSSTLPQPVVRDEVTALPSLVRPVVSSEAQPAASAAPVPVPAPPPAAAAAPVDPNAAGAAARKPGHPKPPTPASAPAAAGTAAFGGSRE